MEVLSRLSLLILPVHSEHSRLEGGAADEDGMSSSGSLDRLRPVRPPAPRFAADMLGRSGELQMVRTEVLQFKGWAAQANGRTSSGIV